ncbi:PLP-dependent aminotransferase family protein [Coralloluteibacterium thermophilus]|uniref:PLP-dependent aminotransferase family protein n=1 Tax=Coralloluteibacterium thermophilum TaxID=2707049 RepID=A0ABV9NRR5_9GAMM
MKRYEALAADIAASIGRGTLRPGDRLPSVRQASASRGVSPATVFEAYYLLEARGLVEARPRSGYYVARRASAAALEPQQRSQPDGEARPVAISELVFEVVASTMSRAVVPLGSAFPSPRLFPLARLGRATAAAVTHLDPWSTVDDLTPGNAALRHQIALRYLLDGAQVGPDEILVTNGAMEALNLCLAAVCAPGDTVLVESPCFYACLQALERLGLKAVEVATDPREGIDLDALDAAIVRHAPRACWLMTRFQNPLGSSMDEAKARALVALVSRHRLPLIEDDVYGELYSGSRRPPAAKAFDREGWVMHCSSFSKTLAPGYRIGWVAPGRFLHAVARHKLALSLATSVPAQLGLARYLERGSYERHLRGLRRTLQAQREAYIEAIGRAFPAGTRVSRPAGGYFLWVEMPARVDALDLHRELMAEGVSLAPGPMFSASRSFAHHLRINAGHPLDAPAAAAVQRLGRAVARRARASTAR